MTSNMHSISVRDNCPYKLTKNVIYVYLNLNRMVEQICDK